MSPRWVRPKWCTSRHPSLEGVYCQRAYDHPEMHRAEIGEPVADSEGILRARVESW